MFLDAKSSDLEGLGSRNLKIEDFSMTQDVKNFEFDVFDSKNSNSELLISEAMSLDAKSFDLDVFGSLNL